MSTMLPVGNDKRYSCTDTASPRTDTLHLVLHYTEYYYYLSPYPTLQVQYHKPAQIINPQPPVQTPGCRHHLGSLHERDDNVILPVLNQNPL